MLEEKCITFGSFMIQRLDIPVKDISNADDELKKFMDALAKYLTTMDAAEMEFKRAVGVKAQHVWKMYGGDLDAKFSELLMRQSTLFGKMAAEQAPFFFFNDPSNFFKDMSQSVEDTKNWSEGVGNMLDDDALVRAILELLMKKGKG